MQRALIQYRNPKNYELVYEALTTAGRTDLIGFDKKCLIRPRRSNAGSVNGAAHSDRKSQKSDNKKAVKKKTIRNVHKKVAK
jgi:hypothetical protein